MTSLSLLWQGSVSEMFVYISWKSAFFLFGLRGNDFGGFLKEDVLYSSLAYSTARRVVSVHKHGQPRYCTTFSTQDA